MKKIRGKYIFLVYSVMVIITVLTVIISVTNKKNLQNVSRDYYDFSEGWVTQEGLPADLSKISGIYTVSTTLPTLREDDVLYFSVKTANVKVYVEDECVYQSEIFNPNLFGYTAGFNYVRIPFDVADSGKKITLELDNPYCDGSGKISQIRIGDSADMLANNISEHFIGLCINVIIVFIGVVFIVWAIPMWKKHATGKEMLYFGFFAFSIGIYLLFDSKLLQEIFQNAHIYHVISEIFMRLIIVPLFLYFEAMYYNRDRHSKLMFAVCILALIDFVISYSLAITGIMDYHQTIHLTQTLYVVAILVLIALVITNAIRQKNDKKYHTMGIISICTGAVLDIVLWNFAPFRDTSFFTRIGTLLFMCFQAMQLLSEFLKDYRKGIHSQILEKLAYHDGLTELLNRTSYMEDVKALESETSLPVLFAFFDVNNLKPINDTYGHAAGDDLLIAVANALRNSFSQLGKCYRIGGDEFVVIAKGDNLETALLDIDKRMKEELLRIQNIGVFPFEISVASGYAVWTDKNRPLNDIIQEADENMYQNKKKMKAEKQHSN